MLERLRLFLSKSEKVNHIITLYAHSNLQLIVRALLELRYQEHKISLIHILEMQAKHSNAIANTILLSST